MRIDPMRVLLAGALSPTGQLVARSLSTYPDFKVYAMCSPGIGGALRDDSGPLTETKVLPSGEDVLVDALVIATDDPPPVASLSKLLDDCSGVQHTVLLSRLGGSTGAKATSAWKALEEEAASCCPDLTIVRFGEPLLGGPYHATDVDLIRWKTAQVVDSMLTAQVAKGDALSQNGFGSSRIVAGSAIASILRRGSERGVASYSVTSDSEGNATTDAQFDALFDQAGGQRAAPAEEDDAAAAAAPAGVRLNFSDERIKAFTEPIAPTPPSPLEALQAAFFGNAAAAGPNWLILIFLVGGLYQCTTPEYIQRTGIDVFGLADGYGISLEGIRTAYGSMNELPKPALPF